MNNKEGNKMAEKEYIRREAAIAAACKALCHPGVLCPDFKCAEVRDAFNAIPAADVRPVVREGTNMSELKHCPFCGSKKIKYDYTHISHGIKNLDICANKHFVGLEFRAWCFCEECHAKSSDVVDFFDLDFVANENWLEIAKNKLYPIAAEAWNRRAT